MNLTRDKAIEAMDALTGAGYTAHIEAVPQTKFVVPNHEGPLYRVSTLALSFEPTDMLELCRLAESVGLVCRYSLQAFRFELPLAPDALPGRSQPSEAPRGRWGV
jgi:hypothetical protein